jgi:DNA (cytosine-5)-methyltransferase 1
MSNVNIGNIIHASLFSGLGGFDLAAEWMGWENAFHCENNPFCKRILNYYWPGAVSYDDIKTTDFSIWRGRIDILSGGFPCQPFALPGKQQGTSDVRYLWPENLRAIQEIKPRWVVGENVPGLVSWSKGMVFQKVCADLENEGYEVLPVLLPAASVGAEHQRKRIWFIAYASGSGYGRIQQKPGRECENKVRVGGIGEATTFTYPDSKGLSKWFQTRVGGVFDSSKTFEGSESSRTYTEGNWSEFPTQSPIFSGNDGLSGKLDGITIPNWRKESCKGAGNAIVPKLALQIFKTIQQYEYLNPPYPIIKH